MSEKEKKQKYGEMTAAELSCCPWWDIEASAAVAAIVKKFFENYRGDQPLGTMKLVRLVAPDLPPACVRPFIGRLQNARDNGMLRGFFDRGRKGPFGAPLVLWHSYKVE